MKLKFVDTATENEPKFKVGDIIALKKEDYGFRTGETSYYFLGLYNDLYYYLVNIETGEMVTVDAPETTGITKKTLAHIIEQNDGKVYNGDKAKLVIEEIKTHKCIISNINI